MFVREISSALHEKAKDELNENLTQIEEEIKQFRRWVVKQQHLRARTDDQWLLTFLRGCKFSQQRARQKFEKFYTMRSAMPEIYANRDPLLPDIQEILTLGLCLPLLRTSDPAGPRIVLVRCPADPSKIPFVKAMKVVLMIIDILLNEDDNFVIAGQMGFLDLGRMTINHALYIDFNVSRKIAMCLQNAYPTRPKGFHCVNTPTFFNQIYNIVKLFATEKLRKRVVVYGKNNQDDLHKSIPLSVLPKEYGGDGESLQEMTDFWKKKVESYRDWFLEDSTYGYKKNNTKNGINGLDLTKSFRNLDID